MTLTTMIMIDPVAYAYSGQDGSGSLPYYVGKQYGTGWLQSLARIAFPILRKVVGHAGTIAANTAEDLISNRKAFGESLRDNTVHEVGKVFSMKRKAAAAKQPSKTINSKRKRIRKDNSVFANQ